MHARHNDARRPARLWMEVVCGAIVAALILTVARGTDNVALAWFGGNDYAGYGKHSADAMEVSPILITSDDGQASAVMAAAGDMITTVLFRFSASSLAD